MIGNGKKRIRAVEAKSYAQFLAFSPFAFQASVTMRDTGLLKALDDSSAGATVSQLAEASGLSKYGVSVLLDLGSNLGIVEQEGDRYTLGAVGYFLLHDEMTRVNMNFTRDVCYDALGHLTESIQESRPAGLHTLGPWNTVYEGLTRLPEPAQTSWFEFDHFYSDRIFDQLLPIVFEKPTPRLLDVGGNTGRWAMKCLNYSPDVHITLMDLPRQLEKARQNIEAAGYGDRASYLEADLLDDNSTFPENIDSIWMSQFLDCFSEEEIESILKRAAASMDENSKLFIVELFPDRQTFDAARFSLDATSLYFTCIANGNSRMYHYERFRKLVEKSGLKIDLEKDLPAGGHTILCCSINSAD